MLPFSVTFTLPLLDILHFTKELKNPLTKHQNEPSKDCLFYARLDSFQLLFTGKKQNSYAIILPPISHFWALSPAHFLRAVTASLPQQNSL